jgi:NAD(P)H-dependent flavin oxidoreductase YrpB (nitropropane dioxygenase family)
MVEGRPDEGVLPAGQVAALIADLPPVAELIARIAGDAEARLRAAAAGGAAGSTPPPKSLLHGVSPP